MGVSTSILSRFAIKTYISTIKQAVSLPVFTIQVMLPTFAILFDIHEEAN